MEWGRRVALRQPAAPFVAIAAAILLLACGARDRPLVIAVPAGPAVLRPNGLNEEFTLSILSNVYETLVDVDNGLGLRPGLAESWHSPDDLTWVFTLRRGVRLHDGRLLTAALAAASLEDARSHPDSRRRLQLSFVEAIEAPDERTLVLRTRRPFDPLPARLSNVAIWAAGENGGYVGSGPYVVREWHEGGDVKLAAFPQYRQGRPRIPSVWFRVIHDAAARVAALRDGDAHLAVDVPADAVERLRATRDLRATVQHGLRVLFLGMDTRERFADVRVRRAVALAVDRAALVRGPLGGYGEVVEEIVSPQELGGQAPRLPARAQDPEEARRLLAEAGFPGGFEVGLEFMPQKYRAMEAVARAIAADLSRVGIRAQPKPCTPAELLSRVEGHAATLYVLGWISDNGDGRMSYEYLLHSPIGGFGVDNGGRYSNPEIDALIERSLTRLDGVDRRAVLSRIAQVVYDDVPVLPLYRQADLYGSVARLVFQPRLDRRLRAWDMSWSD